MDFQHLSDVHTGRYAQWVKHYVQRTAVWKEWHIFYRKYTGNDTLVTMTSSHLITNRDLTFLGDIDTDSLVYAWCKLVTIFSCKYLSVYDDTICTMRYL